MCELYPASALNILEGTFVTRSVRILILLYGALAALAAVAPNHARTAPAAKDARVKLSDAELEKVIRDKFAKSKISVNKFEVHVQGGVARIEGRTNVLQHKGTATRLAKNAGAKQVVNRVVVSEEARQKAAANLEKGRRRVQVKRGDSRDGRK
jgi:hypothetical protein